MVVVFYALYSGGRDIHGSHADAVKQATTNARHIVNLEKDVGIFREQWVQAQFIHHIDFMKFWDLYYDTVHFISVAGVLIFMFLKMPERYRLWRNTLAICTALALVGFALFPLLPPRLLPPSYHFVDSIDKIGGGFSLDSGTVSDVSNLYAAMPSLHTAWSTWCALSLMPLIRRRALKPLILLYPACTVFCIVVTANHYFADAIGGLITLGVAYLLARPLTRRWDQFRAHRYLARQPARAPTPAGAP